jgi:hypothetical protein
MSEDYKQMYARQERERQLEKIRDRAQKRAEAEVRRISRKRGRNLVLSLVILGLFSSLMVVGAVVGPGYTYQKNVHAYMEQAYYSADPVLMQDNINKAKQGMENLGLTPQMYSSFWYWEQTPDKQMLWEYQHLNSIDVRCNEFIAWIHAQNDTGSQQMQDVYSQKLNNIREFIRDDGGWSDDIAQAAYTTNFQVFFAVGYIPVMIALIAIVIWLAALFVIHLDEYDSNLEKKLTEKYIQEEAEKYIEEERKGEQ